MKMKNKGFTLIELIIYSSLMLVMFLGIISFLKTVNEAKQRNRAITEVYQQAVHISNTISRTVRHAEDINSPSAGSNSSSLSLQMADAGVDPMVFSLNSGIVQISENGSTFDLSSDNVEVTNIDFENLSFTDTPGIVRFQIDLRYNTAKDNSNYEYSETFFGSASLR